MYYNDVFYIFFSKHLLVLLGSYPYYSPNADYLKNFIILLMKQIYTNVTQNDVIGLMIILLYSF